MMTMTTTAEEFWMAFCALPAQEKTVVIEKFLEEQDFLEDVIDLAIIAQRQHEASRSLDDYLAERRNVRHGV